MIKKYLFLFVLLLVCFVGWAILKQQTTLKKIEKYTYTSKPIAVLELFTSQGCSSCPSAEKLLQTITQKRENDKNVFSLAFHVTYWNYLGWEDIFSTSLADNRQRLYGSSFRLRSIYTPQLIINGSQECVGSQSHLISKYIEEALQKPAHANIDLAIVSSQNQNYKIVYELKGDYQGMKLNIALVENNLKVDIKRGENKNKVLNYSYVVRTFKTLMLHENGKGGVNIAIPSHVKKENTHLIAYIQNPKNLEIIGASALKF